MERRARDTALFLNFHGFSSYLPLGRKILRRHVPRLVKATSRKVISYRVIGSRGRQAAGIEDASDTLRFPPSKFSPSTPFSKIISFRLQVADHPLDKARVPECSTRNYCTLSGDWSSTQLMGLASFQ